MMIFGMETPRSRKIAYSNAIINAHLMQLKSRNLNFDFVNKKFTCFVSLMI